MEPFSPSEVCLYFYLLSRWNESGREDTFQLKTCVISKDINMTRKMICIVRVKLYERGLIEFTEGERRSCSPVYRIMEHVEVGRQMKTVRAKAETAEVEVDEIPIPPEFQVQEVRKEEKPVKRKKSEKVKPLDKLFKVEEPKKRVKKEFVPPTLQEVEDYFNTLGICDAESRAQQFFFHYDSLGWHTATGAAVHRWDSLANKWLLNDKQKEHEKGRCNSKASDEGDYKAKLYDRFAESERKFREKK